MAAQLVVDEILHSGGRVDVRNSRGGTPLHGACAKGCEAVRCCALGLGLANSHFSHLNAPGIALGRSCGGSSPRVPA